MPPERTYYDAFGRVVVRTDKFGNTTTYAYSADERTTTVSYPVGATQITVIDEEGRTRSLSGIASTPRFYKYGANPDGSQWTTVYKGINASAPAWEKTTTDMLGRTMREEKTGFGDSLLNTEYAYDYGGRIIKQVNTHSINNLPLVIDHLSLFVYDLYGERLFSVQDINKTIPLIFQVPTV